MNYTVVQEIHKSYHEQSHSHSRDLYTVHLQVEYRRAQYGKCKISIFLFNIMYEW